MDGFTGFKPATSEELPHAVAFTDPFHVVRLAVDALDQCRRRVQQDTPAATATPVTRYLRQPQNLRTGADLLTTEQKTRLSGLFATDRHVQVEARWNIYQDMIAAYRNPDPAAGRTAMTTLINTLSFGVPAALTELVTLGPTLKRRAADVLAYSPQGTATARPKPTVSVEHSWSGTGWSAGSGRAVPG